MSAHPCIGLGCADAQQNISFGQQLGLIEPLLLMVGMRMIRERKHGNDAADLAKALNGLRRDVGFVDGLDTDQRLVNKHTMSAERSADSA